MCNLLTNSYKLDTIRSIVAGRKLKFSLHQNNKIPQITPEQTENLKSFKMMVDASYQPEIPTWYGPGSAELSTGTTLVAFEFADGVVMAADSRTSTGSFVAVRVTDKLTPVTSHIMACR